VAAKLLVAGGDAFLEVFGILEGEGELDFAEKYFSTEVQEMFGECGVIFRLAGCVRIGWVEFFFRSKNLLNMRNI
jgi:hypothetical protein